MGYPSNNLFFLDWTEEDYGSLNFYDLFAILYPVARGTQIPYEQTIDGTEYQVKIQASCESGTLAVSASCAGEEWAYTVSPEEPCTESLSLPAGSAGQADFVITIEPDTRGSVIVELWGR